MRNEIKYEWCYETVDEHGDILENDFSDTLSGFVENQKTDTLCLVRTEGNEEDGVQDRVWAYVKDGKLPVQFSDSTGEEIMVTVPEKFYAELKKYFSK